jgi:uncharacterized protein (TIGR02268 family)
VLALSPVALLGLTLLATPADANERAPLPTCETGTRYVELEADAPNSAQEVCIHLGRSTSFLFDSKLARVELAGRKRFRVMEGDDGFTLVLMEALPDGERVPVTVYFQDGAAPASATFHLVVHPSQVEGQVEVTRHPRTIASYQQGEQQARAEAQQCREEKARVQAECGGQGGLTGLIAHGLMGEGGVPSKNIGEDLTPHPGNTLHAVKARSYRSDTERREGQQKVVRLAVALELQNNGKTPWTPVGAVLMGPQHVELKVLSVWPLEPIPSEQKRRIVVEMETTEGEALGTFTLKLWGEGGSSRGELFDGVTFP